MMTFPRLLALPALLFAVGPAQGQSVQHDAFKTELNWSAQRCEIPTSDYTLRSYTCPQPKPAETVQPPTGIRIVPRDKPLQ